MSGFIRSIAFAFVAVALLVAPAWAETREALVIANTSYTKAVGPLTNPPKDARVVAAALESKGFKVKVVEDADRLKILAEARDLAGRLAAGGPGAIGFLYYTGHGAADTDSGRNYLIPVDVASTSTATLWDASVSLDEIKRRMITTAPGARHIIVFDACRDELVLPFKSASKGFVVEAQTGGVFLAFATAPGTKASDGEPTDPAGPYAMALAEELMKGGRDALNLFEDVKQNLRNRTQKTGAPQEAWSINGLPERLWLDAPGSGTTSPIAGAPPGGVVDNDAADWTRLSVLGDTGCRAYLGLYPKGKFAVAARACAGEDRSEAAAPASDPVKESQGLLAAMACGDLAADGIVGPTTRAAADRFRRARGLGPGALDASFVAALKSANASGFTCPSEAASPPSESKPADGFARIGVHYRTLTLGPEDWDRWTDFGGGCDENLQPIPAGWHLVSDERTRAIAPWASFNTNVLASASGPGYWVKRTSSVGKLLSNNSLRIDGSKVSGAHCHIMVLLERDGVEGLPIKNAEGQVIFGPGAISAPGAAPKADPPPPPAPSAGGYAMIGSDFRTLKQGPDKWQQTTGSCDDAYMSIPAGWRIASEKQVAAVALEASFGASALTGLGGRSYWARGTSDPGSYFDANKLEQSGNQYKVAHCWISVLLVRDGKQSAQVKSNTGKVLYGRASDPSFAPPPPAPVSGPSGNHAVLGSDFRTLGKGQGDWQQTIGGCDENFATIPAGWRIASETQVKEVAKVASFGASALVGSNGRSYWALGSSNPGSYFDEGKLVQSGGQAKVKHCYISVLLVRDGKQGAGVRTPAGGSPPVSDSAAPSSGGSAMLGSDFRTLGKGPGDWRQTTGGCDENFMAIPAGWRIASESQVKEVAKQASFGASALVGSNGQSYWALGSSNAGAYFDKDKLVQSGNQAKVKHCYISVLLVRDGKQNAAVRAPGGAASGAPASSSGGYALVGSDFRTLGAGAEAWSNTVGGCDDQFKPIPAGWRIASEQQVRAVSKVASFGASALVGVGGRSYWALGTTAPGPGSYFDADKLVLSGGQAKVKHCYISVLLVRDGKQAAAVKDANGNAIYP